jgi:hypothetical protein
MEAGQAPRKILTQAPGIGKKGMETPQATPVGKMAAGSNPRLSPDDK